MKRHPMDWHWQPAFVAIWLTQGGSLDEAHELLGDATGVESLLAVLRAGTKATRAAALAKVLVNVARDVEARRLA